MKINQHLSTITFNSVTLSESHDVKHSGSDLFLKHSRLSHIDYFIILD